MIKLKFFFTLRVFCDILYQITRVTLIKSIENGGKNAKIILISSGIYRIYERLYCLRPSTVVYLKRQTAGNHPRRTPDRACFIESYY